MGTRAARRVVPALVAAAALAGCGGDSKPSTPTPAAETSTPAVTLTPSGPQEIPNTIGFTSPDFEDGGTLPVANTCSGAGTPPTLVYAGVPQSTEMAITVVDPDAPGGEFLHWSVYRMPINPRGLIEKGKLLAGIHEGINSAGKSGWTPPCPPKGDPPHRYVFTIYAIGPASELADGADAAEVQKMIADGAVARGILTGTFGR